VCENSEVRTYVLTTHVPVC